MPDADLQKARLLFQEALSELGITKKEFPRLVFIHGIQDAFLTKVIQLVVQSWQQLFDIECKVEKYPWSVVFDRMLQGDFQLGFICWEAWVDDPIYTLNAFRYRNEQINFSNWENLRFQQLLDAADQAVDMEKRREYIAQAEAIVIQEVPVIPILYEVQQFMKKSYVKVPMHKNIGTFSFSSASILNSPCVPAGGRP